jgi:hypothetical protein
MSLARYHRRMRGRVDEDATTPRDARHDYWGVVLDAPDALALARFYSELLGWPLGPKADEDGASIIGPEGMAYISFQREPKHQRPVWPAGVGDQQMQLHLDFEVSDLAAAVEHAIELGATQADFQPQDNVRVLLDPAGHPFCLYTGE